MEAIATDAFRIEMLGEGEMVGNGAVAPMERRIETGDLRQLRKPFEQRADRRQVVGLVQRRQWRVAFQARQDRAVDQESGGRIPVRRERRGGRPRPD